MLTHCHYLIVTRFRRWFSEGAAPLDWSTGGGRVGESTSTSRDDSVVASRRSATLIERYGGNEQSGSNCASAYSISGPESSGAASGLNSIAPWQSCRSASAAAPQGWYQPIELVST